MNLTQEQRDLLKMLVERRNLGQFTLSCALEGKHLIYAPLLGVNPDVSSFDSLDFEQLASEGLITFDKSRRDPVGKVTQKGISAVEDNFSSYLAIGRHGHPASRTPRYMAELNQMLGSKTPPVAFKKPSQVTPAPSDVGSPRSLEEAEEQQLSTKQKKPVVFIGHGRSNDWLQLDRYLTRTIKLDTIDFNSVPTAGLSNKERLEEMLKEANFAFLVMTAEDEHADGKQHARENVIHEVGLFQGRLGFLKAIPLIESGCEYFSNIHGITHIAFEKGNIQGCFHKVHEVLQNSDMVPH